MAPLLSVRAFSASFATEAGLARVLNSVNLTIGHGEIVGLIGESGSGKTTLARAILGVLPGNTVFEGGAIAFDGRDWLAAGPAEQETVRGRDITFVPQDPLTAFNPLFTIGDQIMELMRWKSPERPPRSRIYGRARRSRDRERAVAMLRAVQLPDPEGLLAKYPHEISGGQRQRVIIAMALLPEPKLIVADEPTTALDVTIQAQILALLRQLASERGASVLFTTHDLGAAWEICDRITVMYAGQELEAAPSGSFFGHPMVPYTRQLLESLPSRGNALASIPGEVPSMLQPPGGCRFHPRCYAATERCRQDRPGESIQARDHVIRCFHPQQDALQGVPSL